jgi:hypothetical protein
MLRQSAGFPFVSYHAEVFRIGMPILSLATSATFVVCLFTYFMDGMFLFFSLLLYFQWLTRPVLQVIFLHYLYGVVLSPVSQSVILTRFFVSRTSISYCV